MLLRRPLGELIPLLRELRYKDLQLKFGQKLVKLKAQADEAEIPAAPVSELPSTGTAEATVRKAMEPIADVSPRAAVSESWREVDHALDDYFERLGLPRPRSYQGMRRVLHEEGGVVNSALTLYEEMRLLRNQAVHARESEIDPKQALEFANLADRVIASLKAAAEQKKN